MHECARPALGRDRPGDDVAACPLVPVRSRQPGAERRPSRPPAPVGRGAWCTPGPYDASTAADPSPADERGIWGPRATAVHEKGPLISMAAGQRPSVEPPIGIEPMTYSLRVNRSAD